MAGQQVGHLLDAALGEALGRRPGPPVQLAPPAIGQALVGDVARQRLAEAPALAVGLDEVAQLGLHDRAEGDVVGPQDQLERLGPEAQPEHRRAAQHLAGVPGEGVDLRAEHRLQRVRQRRGSRGRRRLRHVPQQLLQEERVAGGAGDDRPHVVGTDVHVGSGPDQLGRLAVGQGGQRDDGLVGVRRPAGSAAGRRREMTSHGRPSAPSAAAATRASRLVDASSSQCASSTTTTSGPVMHMRQQAHERVGLAVRAEAGLQLVHLGRRGDLQVGDLGDQRRHRQEAGIELPQAVQELAGHRGGIVPAHAEQVAHGVPEGPQGEGDAVRLAPDGDRADPTGARRRTTRRGGAPRPRAGSCPRPASPSTTTAPPRPATTSSRWRRSVVLLGDAGRRTGARRPPTAPGGRPRHPPRPPGGVRPCP